jgi:excisionase family DNA binding protein
MKQVLTTGDVAKHCGVSLSTVFRWIKEGYISAYTTPGGHHRIVLGEFHRFLQRNDMPIPESVFTDAELRRRVLVVDDDPRIIEMITDVLADCDRRYEVSSATDGFEAGMMISSFHPHLVILDLMMPRVNGFDICRRIRLNPETSSVKILAVTGFANSANRDRILSLGADDYLEKPLDTGQLVDRVSQLLAA